MTVTLERPIVITPCLSCQYRTKYNERWWNKKRRWALYLAHTPSLQTSKGTVHGQVRDCTSASPICRLLWHSSSSLTPPSHPLFLSSPKPSPPPPPPPAPLLFQPLFFAAPTSSFTPSSPPPLSRKHERSLHTGPPFPRADGLSPFLHVRTPRRENYLRFHLSFPSLSLFLPSSPSPSPFLPSHGCERVI